MESQNQVINEGGKLSLVSGPKAVNLFACRAVLLAIKAYVEHGMQMNRSYTPQNMRAFVTGKTGKQYKRGTQGLVDAFNDLNAYMADPAQFEGVEVINR